MSFINFWFYPALLLLLGLVALLQLILKKKERWSNILSKLTLLAFSYVVMGLYNPYFCICLLSVTLFTYAAGLAIRRAIGGGMSRRLYTVGAVTVLLVVLGVFKYFNFFLSTAFLLAHKTWTDLNILLPLGISFYIFSAIGYILDVSWEKLEAEQSFFDMALFLSFFPKQVCGPIVNARDFLPQLKENRRITLKGLESGVQIFLFGFFKKLVLADHLAVFVDEVFAAPAAFGTATLWLAVFGYFIQLYFDFSGYSDMAVGASKMFGYDLQRNFNLPFIAQNISEFWDRWHISLSSWLNEYLFNPIALVMKRAVAEWPKERRKKCKNLPTYTALLLTFCISGLWHGAGFTFIVWGAFHGVYSILHSMYVNWMHKHDRDFAQKKPGAVRVLDILANYFVLNLIQVFFRADSLGQAGYILKRMFTVHVGVEQPYVWAFFAGAVLFAGTMIAFVRSRKRGLQEVEGFYPKVKLNTVFGLTVFFVMCGMSIALGYFGETYFIYGNF